MLINFPSETATLTTSCRHDNFVGWHQGRPFYAVWLVMADTSAIREVVHHLRHSMGDWLLPDYRRQPHITLGIRGFPQSQPQDEHSYIPALFRQDIARLQQLPRAHLRLRCQGADSFTTAPYLTLTDLPSNKPQHTLLHWHEILTPPSGIDTTPGYIPHITAGFYRRAIPLPAIRQTLASLTLPPCDLTISHIELAAYASEEIAGRLQTICRYDLLTQELEMIRPHLLPWM